MDRFSGGDPESQFGCFESGAREKNQLSTLAGTCTVCRLYVQVDWGHKDLGFQIHPQQQVLEARVVAEGVQIWL